ncbi:MAG: hypothetical protein KKF68_03375 [Nanoarchaeota archaeon]|nr:hypothetical protein [Nanoarchaeota archaeon]
MEKIHKNILYIIIISIITLLTIFVLASIPGYLRPLESEDIAFTQPKFIIVFIIVDIILIGIPAGLHYIYIKDYTKIKSVWFFAIFGGVTGAFLGEIATHNANPLIIIPYIILMLIYAFFYKKFTWWKVILTTYLGGVIIENAINRSPIQIPSLIWIAFFTYPYFITKIWENRKNISLISIIKDFKWAIFFSIILGISAGYFFREGPLFFFALTIPFIMSISYKLLFNKKKKQKISMISTIKSLKYVIISSVILICLTVYITKNNASPPLIIFGTILPFIVYLIYKLIKKSP